MQGKPTARQRALSLPNWNVTLGGGILSGSTLTQSNGCCATVMYKATGSPSVSYPPTAEHRRLADSEARRADWKHWGPYVSERAWGTVREDYSAAGDAWTFFPHDHARSRAYRWNEDGLAGYCNRFQNLCLALALWNGHDPILKERFFGLTGPEGNHGEDVKEYYFYLDSTPTHSYMRMLYKYPQVAYPYAFLVEENRRRDRTAREFELIDALGEVFQQGRYFDVFVEYAKAAPGGTSSAGSRPLTEARQRPRCMCCRTCGSVTPGRGATPLHGPSCALWRGRPLAPSTTTSADAGGISTAFRTGPRSCSPRTTPTPSASLASPMPDTTSRTASARPSCMAGPTGSTRAEGLKGRRALPHDSRPRRGDHGPLALHQPSARRAVR